MEKLDLKIFRDLRQELVTMKSKLDEDMYMAEESIFEEEQKEFTDRYKEIINILSEHDLSDIDFEEWRGIFLEVSEETPIDFSKTKANLDFSIIEYESYETFPNGCKNFSVFHNLPVEKISKMVYHM